MAILDFREFSVYPLQFWWRKLCNITTNLFRSLLTRAYLNRNQGLSTKQIRYVLYSITNTFIAQLLHNLKSTTQHNKYDNDHIITTQQHKHRFAELYASFISRDNC